MSFLMEKKMNKKKEEIPSKGPCLRQKKRGEEREREKSGKRAREIFSFKTRHV